MAQSGHFGSGSGDRIRNFSLLEMIFIAEEESWLAIGRWCCKRGERSRRVFVKARDMMEVGRRF